MLNPAAPPMRCPNCGHPGNPLFLPSGYCSQWCELESGWSGDCCAGHADPNMTATDHARETAESAEPLDTAPWWG